MRSFTGTSLLALAFAAPLAAQQPAGVAGSTPAECMQSANRWRTQQAQAEQRAGRSADYTKILAEARAQTRACAAKFDLETLPPADLQGLAELYLGINEPEAARRVLDHALAAKDRTARQHAELLALSVRMAFIGVDVFAGLNQEAERIVRQLDQLPDSLNDVKIRAHQVLLGQYGYADNDDGIRHHAQALIDLGRKTGKRAVMVNGFSELARAHADFLHPDSALLVLDRAEDEFGVPRGSTAAFSGARALYALVGTPGAAVSGELWINPDAPGGSVPMGDGKVYLVQFTAHWCAPCRNSYPGLKRVAERFAGKPFEVLFVTETYGNFEGKKMTIEEEIEADRRYYAEHHGLPFRIAVNPIRAPQPGQPAKQPALNDAYRVGGIPQIVVLDGKGTIRQVVIGWDHGNEQRLGAFIEELLRESATR